MTQPYAWPQLGFGFTFNQNQIDSFLKFLFDEGETVKFERDPDIIEVEPIAASTDRSDAIFAASNIADGNEKGDCNG